MTEGHYTIVPWDHDRVVVLISTGEYVGQLVKHPDGWTWKWYDVKHTTHVTDGEVKSDLHQAAIALIEDYAADHGIPLPDPWPPSP